MFLFLAGFPPTCPKCYQSAVDTAFLVGIVAGGRGNDKEEGGNDEEEGGNDTGNV